MLNIDNMRITTKIVLIVAMLGLVAAGIAGYAVYRMTSADSAFSDLISRVDTSAVKSARAGRDAESYLAASYQIAAETTDAGNIALTAEAADDKTQYLALMASVAQALPEKSDAIQSTVAGMQQVFAVCDPINTASAADTSTDSIVKSDGLLKATCVPGIKNGLKQQIALTDDLIAYAAQTSADLTDQAGSAIRIMLGSAAVGLLFTLAAALWIGIKGLARPIGHLKSIMDALSRHDLSVEIPGGGREDEVGDMTKAVMVFKANMIETTRLRAEQEDIRKLGATDRRQAMVELAGKFETRVGGIVEGVSAQATELQATAQAMAATAEETSRQTAAVAAASEQATQNVNTVAAATEELSASVAEIMQQVTLSTREISEAVTEADGANQQMQGLSESVRKIGEVVTLINNIASQTNLLALNATIEAARAGDAGKGFAVVASEVKALASQTAKATEVISAQVAAIQEVTRLSVHSIQNINTRIARVSETATAIASAVEEQGAATREIARNVAEAAKGTAEVSSNIAGVSEAAGQTGASASEVLASAGDLSRNSEALRAQVGAFLKEVRAA